MFSVEFGQNTSQIWLISFAIATGCDIICKDVFIAAITVVLALYLPMLKEKCKKRENKYKIAAIDSEGISKSSKETNK